MHVRHYTSIKCQIDLILLSYYDDVLDKILMIPSINCFFLVQGILIQPLMLPILYFICTQGI